MANKEITTGVKFTGDAKGFKSAAEDAKKATASLKQSAKKDSGAISGSFKGIEDSIGGIKSIIMAGGVLTAVKVFKEVLGSTQLTGDDLEKTMAGIEGAASTLAQNIANMDFSVSIKEAFRAAKEFEEYLDDAGDRQRSLSAISAKNRLELEKLKGVMTNVNTSTEERLAASKKIEEITKSELDLRKNAADTLMAGENNSLEKKYNITKAQAELVRQYVLDYSYYTKEQQDDLTEAMKSQQRLDYILANQGKIIGQEGPAEYAKDLKNAEDDAAKSASKVVPALRQYITLWRPISDLSDKHREAIVKIGTDYYDAATALQVYKNKADKTNDKLLDSESAIKKALDGQYTAETLLFNIEYERLRLGRKLSKTINSATGTLTKRSSSLGGAASESDSSAAMDTMKSVWDTSGDRDRKNAEEAEAALQDLIAKKQQAINDAFSNSVSIFQSLGDVIGGATGNWISWVGQIIGDIPAIMQAFSALNTAQAETVFLNTAAAGTGAAASVADVPIAGPALAIAAITTVIAAIMGAVASIPKMADGAVVNGATYAMIGEAGPEAVLNRMQLGGLVKELSNGGGGNYKLTGKLKGSDILISAERASQSRSRNT